jgi:hypothetical protein
MAAPTSQIHESTILYCPKEIKMYSVKGGFQWHTVHTKFVKIGQLVQYFTCTSMCAHTIVVSYAYFPSLNYRAVKYPKTSR